MKSFVVTMLDRVTGEMCRVIVQSECSHGMQEFIDQLANAGQLSIANPVVLDVDDRAASHLPIVEPVVE